MEQQKNKETNHLLCRNNLNERITLLSQIASDIHNSRCENETLQQCKPAMIRLSSPLSSAPPLVRKRRLSSDTPDIPTMLIPIQDHRRIVVDDDDLFLTRQLLTHEKSKKKQRYNQTTIDNHNHEQLTLYEDYFNQRQQQLTNHLLNKRTRYEKINELENQPPVTKRNQKQQEQQQMNVNDLNNYIHDEILARQNRGRYPIINDMLPSYFSNQLPLSNYNSTLFSVDQTTDVPKHSNSYYRTSSAPNHHPCLDHSQQQIQAQVFPYRREIPVDVVRSLSPTLTTYDDEQTILRNVPLSTKKNIKATSQTNSMVIRRNENSINTTPITSTANNKNNCNRNGNISPTYSETSSETSSCSSDENYLFQQRCRSNSIGRNSHWRSYRERENYEALLDLAEKLSDPNRFNQFDVRQFLSYRYKAPNTSTSGDEVSTIRRSGRISPQNRHTIIPSTTPTSSTQTGCVICMCPFKNRQCIRQLPCGHEYHSKCIQKWLDMNSTCPLCRQDWRGSIYHTM
ncbi:unnamed protein product [Didymodactylos carnosus]|uniref:RING-type domain-containing protein n=1 Tax=Didymodactylos carnosus TaxID=1234261 RepID=A0A813R5I6_9BILA|nr:unnamed protein product [Didymodactylos carnosus]CAF1272144.1 unnamed protein product [Didymodactylos carnosus]CAF3561880.1 unnamed protein product [Didymodactylos carnosus]CAF4077499.1 unnamed protein product [Didymodactylos carnosus]